MVEKPVPQNAEAFTESKPLNLGTVRVAKQLPVNTSERNDWWFAEWVTGI